MSQQNSFASLADQLKAAGAASLVLNKGKVELDAAISRAETALSVAQQLIGLLAEVDAVKAASLSFEEPAPVFEGLYAPKQADRDAAKKALLRYLGGYFGRAKNTATKIGPNADVVLTIDLVEKIVFGLVRVHEELAKAKAAHEREQLSNYAKAMTEVTAQLARIEVTEADPGKVLERHSRSALDRGVNRLKAKADEAMATFTAVDRNFAANPGNRELQNGFERARKQLEVTTAVARIFEEDAALDRVTRATRLIHELYKMDVFAYRARQRLIEKAGRKPKSPTKVATVAEAPVEPIVGKTIEVPKEFADRADDFSAYVEEKGKAPGNVGVLTRWVNARNAAA